MRQEFGDLMVFMRGQVCQHILQARIRVMTVELSALNQAHDLSRTLAYPQGTRE